MHRERPDELPDAARREWYLTDIMLAAFRGLLADGVLRDPGALDVDRSLRLQRSG